MSGDEFDTIKLQIFDKVAMAIIVSIGVGVAILAAYGTYKLIKPC